MSPGFLCQIFIQFAFLFFIIILFSLLHFLLYTTSVLLFANNFSLAYLIKKVRKLPQPIMTHTYINKLKPHYTRGKEGNIDIITSNCKHMQLSTDWSENYQLNCDSYITTLLKLTLLEHEWLSNIILYKYKFFNLIELHLSPQDSLQEIVWLKSPTRSYKKVQENTAPDLVV